MSKIVILGAGRMGRGIAQAYAAAGEVITLCDVKDRPPGDSARVLAEAKAEIKNDLTFLASIGLGSEVAVGAALERISFLSRSEAPAALADADIIFEGVPETQAAKRALFQWACQLARGNAVMSSTSSTMSVSDLAKMGTHPERFVSGHWLNPAMLMPLVEVARSSSTDQTAVDTLTTSLEHIGKHPVVMKDTPGYIVPRLQAMALNEAARMAEEGVAAPEDIDKAVRMGFGVRYAILGLLEFIDFGGNDILYYATDYLSKNLDANRFSSPPIVAENMKAGRNGIRDGKGILDWEGVDIPAYRAQRLEAFVNLLSFLKLGPKMQR
ncbi:MAG: 3-hydroxyacyl-CoA dehydrogenase NAD-binding domain-containing protein [Pseudomonadota bacterium]